MDYIEKAINKAKQGGYSVGDHYDEVVGRGIAHRTAVYAVIFLDRSFWQSLGKALGWGETKVHYRTKTLDTSRVSKKGVVKVHIPSYEVNRVKKTPMKWKREWHNLIDHLAAGKEPDEYFKEILKHERP